MGVSLRAVVGLGGFTILWVHQPENAVVFRETGQARSNTAIDSTCAVCGNMFTTPAATQR